MLPEGVFVEVALQLPAELQLIHAIASRKQLGKRCRVRMERRDGDVSRADVRRVPPQLFIAGVSYWPTNVVWRDREVTVTYVTEAEWNQKLRLGASRRGQ